MSASDDIKKARQAWEAQVLERTLARAPERSEKFETTSGI